MLQPILKNFNKCLFCGKDAISYWHNNFIYRETPVKDLKWWNWCLRHKKQVQSIVPKEVSDYFTIHDRPKINLGGNYNEVILKGAFAKDNEYLGRGKDFFIKYNGKGDCFDDFKHLYNVNPGKKFLIYDINNGMVLMEVKKRAEAEKYLDNDKVLVYRD